MAGGEDLPAGWTSHKDPDTNFTYYFHAATGESRWEKPLPAGAHKPAAPSGAPTQAQQVHLHAPHPRSASRTRRRSHARRAPASAHAPRAARRLLPASAPENASLSVVGVSGDLSGRPQPLPPQSRRAQERQRQVVPR